MDIKTSVMEFTSTWIVSFILMLPTPSGGNMTDTSEHDLVRWLFRDYEPAARPGKNSSLPVQVTLDFYLAQIDELNAKKQVLKVNGWLSATWNDHRLRWDPDQYGGLNMLVVPPTKVWLPSFSLDNSAGDVYQEDHYKLFRVAITSDGDVTWEPGGHWASSCDIKVFYYPFDDQECELLFANWVYTGRQVNLSAGDDFVHRETYVENGEWDILTTTVTWDDFYMNCCPEDTFPEVAFKLLLRRKSLYYVVNIILPSVMLTVLVLLVFHIPPDAGEKTSMGVTLLLSYSVFMLVIAENVPNTSENVPIIQIYLIYFMGMTSLTVAISVLVLYTHHRGAASPPPYWVRHLVLGVLARLVRHRTEVDRHKDRLQRQNSQHRTTTEDIVRNIERTLGDIRAPERTDPVENLVNLAVRYVTQREQQQAVSDQLEERRRQWKEVGRILDKFFFWVSLFLILVLSLAILVFIPMGKPEVPTS